MSESELSGCFCCGDCCCSHFAEWLVWHCNQRRLRIGEMVDTIQWNRQQDKKKKKRTLFSIRLNKWPAEWNSVVVKERIPQSGKWMSLSVDIYFLSYANKILLASSPLKVIEILSLTIWKLLFATDGRTHGLMVDHAIRGESPSQWGNDKRPSDLIQNGRPNSH